MIQSSVACRNAEIVTIPFPPSSGQQQQLHGLQDNHPAAPRGKSRALWWSLGGTILSAVGFVALAAFEQYNSSLSELRADLKHFNEISGELVKKDSMRKCIDHLIECKQELQAVRLSKENLAQELATVHKDREEMKHEIQYLRERLASLEGRQSATPIIVPVVAPSAPSNEPSMKTD
jgi:hypothetical protein